MMVRWECTVKGCAYHRQEQDFLKGAWHDLKGRSHPLRKAVPEPTPATPWEVVTS